MSGASRRSQPASWTRARRGGAAALAVLGVVLALQWPSARAANEGFSHPDPAAIDDLIRKGDAGSLAEANRRIEEWFRFRGPTAADIARHRWIAPLHQAGRHAEAAALARRAIIAFPRHPECLQDLQRQHAQALLKAGHSDAALSAARGLYNVSTLRGTSAAIEVVCECLAAARPDDPTIGQRFRQEQVAGMRPHAGDGRPGETVLSSITMDPKSYDDGLRKWEALGDYASLASRGNLLLLAGRAAEAEAAFRKAYAIAEAEHLAEAAENVARAIRAVDGTVGRANAWALAVRTR